MRSWRTIPSLTIAALSSAPIPSAPETWPNVEQREKIGLEVTENALGGDRMHPTIASMFNCLNYNYASSSWCALMYDAWFNVLGSTLLATAVLGIRPGDDLESNLLYRLFTDPVQRTTWLEWESEVRMAVGMFRHGRRRAAELVVIANPPEPVRCRIDLRAAN